VLLVGGDISNLTHNTMSNVQNYASATGSGDIGLRYKGMMLGIVPALVIALSFLGNLLGIDTLKAITDTTVTQLVEAIFAAVASVLTLWGILRPYLPARK
jgi:high-affinity Fe2+/Pb2+ permease